MTVPPNTRIDPDDAHGEHSNQRIVIKHGTQEQGRPPLSPSISSAQKLARKCKAKNNIPTVHVFYENAKSINQDTNRLLSLDPSFLGHAVYTTTTCVRHTHSNRTFVSKNNDRRPHPVPTAVGAPLHPRTLASKKRDPRLLSGRRLFLLLLPLRQPGVLRGPDAPRGEGPRDPAGAGVAPPLPSDGPLVLAGRGAALGRQLEVPYSLFSAAGGRVLLVAKQARKTDEENERSLFFLGRGSVQ